jgi:hypothetical protein
LAVWASNQLRAALQFKDGRPFHQRIMRPLESRQMTHASILDPHLLTDQYNLLIGVIMRGLQPDVNVPAISGLPTCVSQEY